MNELLEPNEIQICTDGLRFSSFTINADGLPFLSPKAEEILCQPLTYKLAFDELWVAINGPEDEIGLSEPSYRALTDAEILELSPSDVEKLRKIIKRLNENWYTSPRKSELFYDRAVHKLAWFMKAGYVLRSESLDAVTTIGLFSTVTHSEMKMSDHEFYENWSEDSALTTYRRRLAKGWITTDGSPAILKKRFKEKKCLCQKCGDVFIALSRRAKNCPKCGGQSNASQESVTGQRDCKSGEKCLNTGKKNRPAPAAKGKQYCTENCHGSDKARRERAIQPPIAA